MQPLFISLCTAALLGLPACDRPSPAAEPDPEETTEAAAPLKLSLTDWHRARARAFSTVEDLATIIDEAAHHRLLLLGASSRGDREAIQWRARLSLAIAEEHDLDFIAIEADQSIARAADSYVLGEGGEDDIEELLIEKARRWPRWEWANQEFADFLRQLRAHNHANTSRPIRIYGVDLLDYHPTIDLLNDLAETYHPDQAAALAEHLECLGQHAPDPDGYARALHDGHSQDESGPIDCEAESARAFALTMELFDDDDHDHLLARTSAHMIRGAEAHQRTRMGGHPADHWNARARPLFAITHELLNAHGPDARGAVWAHNTHVADARASRRGDQDLLSLGQLARQHLGEDAVLSVGLFFYRGPILAAREENEAPQIMVVPDPQPESLEELLFRLHEDDHFLIFDEEDDNLPFFDARPTQRSINAAYNPERERFGNYVPINPAAAYDIALFFNTIAPLSPLSTL